MTILPKKSRKKKITKPQYNINIWINHVAHLASGLIFQKECRICVMDINTYKMNNIPKETRANARFYDGAVKSGRKSISFSEL